MNTFNNRTLNLAALTVMCLLLAAPALAQKVNVKLATPAQAERETTDLEVVIDGNGFDESTTFAFYVNGTCEKDVPCDTGGVTVNNGKNVFVSSRKMKTYIDVDLQAKLGDFDIEATTSIGRRGKGTDLFRVLEKGSGSGSANSELSAKFFLFLQHFDDGLSHDGQAVYEDSRKDKVSIFTGSGPGFRFDTNTSKNSPQRTVGINFSGGSVDIKDNDGVVIDTLYSAQYNIDLRFNKNSPTEGLDIGAMHIGEVDYVPIDMSFNPLEGSNSYGLAWGVDSMPFSHGYLANNPCIANYGLNAQVERKTAGSWRIRSNPDDANACLWFINHESLDGNQDGTVVSMPFDFTIEIK